MKFFKLILFCLLGATSFVLFKKYFITHKKVEFTMNQNIKTIDDLKKLFPTTVDEIVDLANKAIKDAQQAIQSIVSIPLEKQNFETIAHSFDKAIVKFRQALNTLEILVMISPDPDLRKMAEEQSILLQKHAIDLFSQNKDLYTTLKNYNEQKAPHESLTQKELYFLDEILKDYKRNGLDLPEAERQKAITLTKELAELTTEFDKNIYADNSTITVTRDELAGLDDNFIESLKKTDDGRYILGIDYPTFNKVMSFCSVGSTRKKLYELYTNRAYPKNESVLSAIIQKRHELATLLGFPSFAHLSLDSEMVKTPERAEEFLRNLISKINVKETLEFKDLTKNLPESIKLSDNGKIYPWDRLYLLELYKKNNFNIDENEISNYFPMENTLKELLAIYHQFLDIDLTEQPINGLWDSEIRLITVHKNKQLLGYLLLDLYPRENKYNHACQATIIPALRLPNNTVQPAVAVVIANFPKPTANQPSLLKRKDVTTFFHEFGHALHALLGATKLGSLSGTNVKTDFVEMPSQMLEEWLWDDAILKQVSSHYQTNKPLSDDIIKTLIDLKNIDTGNQLQNQLVYALLSLNYFKEDAPKDLHGLFKTIFNQIKNHDEFFDNSHFYASFGHLTGYGAKYYSYLWSKVFALDLFDTIRKQGLLNPVIGTRYRDTILAKGGSKDPNELLVDFLGREPNQDAFIQDLGL